MAVPVQPLSCNNPRDNQECRHDSQEVGKGHVQQQQGDQESSENACRNPMSGHSWQQDESVKVLSGGRLVASVSMYRWSSTSTKALTRFSFYICFFPQKQLSG